MNWLVFSSADPEKISLTLKGAFALLAFLSLGAVEPSIQDEFTRDAVQAAVTFGLQLASAPPPSMAPAGKST